VVWQKQLVETATASVAPTTTVPDVPCRWPHRAHNLPRSHRAPSRRLHQIQIGPWKIFEDRQNPSSIRLQARLRRRLTEDHIGALGRQSFLASTCDRRAKLATKLEIDGIGDAREHGADAAAETRLSCEQNSYFSGY
jgi:hypothetical protein